MECEHFITYLFYFFLIWFAILLAKVFFATSFHMDERGEELEYKWRRCTTIWDFIRACVLYTTNAGCHWERERVRDLNEFVGRLMGRRTQNTISLCFDWNFTSRALSSRHCCKYYIYDESHTKFKFSTQFDHLLLIYFILYTLLDHDLLVLFVFLFVHSISIL